MQLQRKLNLGEGQEGGSGGRRGRRKKENKANLEKKRNLVFNEIQIYFLKCDKDISRKDTLEFLVEG